MKQILFCLSVVFQCICSKAQVKTELKDVFTMDTILYLDDFKDFDQYKELCVGEYNNNYYVVYFDKRDKSYSLNLYAIDKSTFIISTHIFSIGKKFSKKFERAVLKAFVINRSEAIFFIGNEFLSYDLASHKFLGSTPYDYDISFLKSSGNLLWYGYCYNKTKQVGKNPKSMIGRASLKGNVYNERVMDFDGIAFTHFEPNHFIDATENNILFAQTIHYQITIYDTAFQINKEIKREAENWKLMDTATLKGIAKSIPSGRAVDLIDALVPYHNGKISRVDGTWFVNDTTILVRYYMPIESQDFMKYKYYFDVWTKTIISSEWTLLYRDLTDEDHLNTTKHILTKNDIPLKSWINSFYVGSTHALVLKNVAKVFPYGDSYVNVKAKQKEYIKQNNPVTAIYFYKFVK